MTAREQILAYYAQHSPDGIARCTCCGSTEALEVDHTDGGGNAHRRTIKRRGSSFYRWVIQQKAWAEFGLLCKPCNVSKSAGAACMLDHENIQKLSQIPKHTQIPSKLIQGRKPVGRPKKNIVKVTLSLTEENSQWLHERPDMSAVVNALIDQARGEQIAPNGSTPDGEPSPLIGEGENNYSYLTPQACASPPTPMTEEPPEPRRSLWGLFRR